MDNLINETNARIQDIIDNLETIKNEYENKLDSNANIIEEELNKVKQYKEEFFSSKEKIEKMNADIEGFEEDYKNLVDRFKDDELANILIAANKEISAKIEERKRKIVKDKAAMNELVEKAENVKKKLVKLTAEKKALEVCLEKILDSYEFYSKALGQVIDYSNDNKANLCACFYEEKDSITLKPEEEIEENNNLDEEILDDAFSDDEIINEDIEVEDGNIEDIDIDEENDEIEEEVIEEDEISEIEFNDEEILDDENSIDLDDIKEIDLDDITTNDEIDNDEDTITDEEENSEENDDDEVIEGEEHEVIMEEMPSQDYDFNASLDLENIINFDDSLEDDDSLYEEKKEDTN